MVTTSLVPEVAVPVAEVSDAVVPVAEAQAAIDRLGPAFPYPSDVGGCVADRLAHLPAAAGSVQERDIAPEVVLSAGATCMQVMHGAPAFVAGLAAGAPGGLSEGQRRCATAAYLAIDEGDLALVAAAALAPAPAGEQVEGTRAAIRRIAVDCDIPTKGR